MKKHPSKRPAKSKAPKAPQSPPERAPAVAAVVATHKERLEAAAPFPKIRVTHEGNTACLDATHGPDPEALAVALHNACGTVDRDFADKLIDDVLNAATTATASSSLTESEANAALARLHGIAPNDELEGLLAAQMVATHSVAMRLLQRAKATSGAESVGLAVKLLRTFTAQVEALQRYRGKGKQTVTVEHIHIHAHPGRQAQVNLGGGPGAQSKTESQPHAIPERGARRAALPGSLPTERPALPAPAMPNGRCRMHGGKSPGAPKGNKHALKHGRYSAAVIAERRAAMALLRAMRHLS